MYHYFKKVYLFEDPKLITLALNLSAVPLVYIVSLALLSWFRKCVYESQDDSSSIITQYSTFNNTENQQQSSSSYLRPRQNLESYTSWNSVFSSSNLPVTFYSHIAKLQVLLSLVGIVLSLLPSSLPGDESYVIVQWYTIHLFYWLGYYYFVINFRFSLMFTREFLLFNLFAWGISPVIYIIGFLIINEIERQFIWYLFFFIFLVQIIGTLAIGISDIVHVFSYLVYEN